MLAAIGAENARVFDAFAGEGILYRRVWHRAASYVGCDLKWVRDARLMYAGDSRRVMRALHLQDFNIFDLDAYGCPWEQAYIIARRRPVQPGERLGLVITEGQAMKFKLSGMSGALAHLAGVDPRRMTGIGKHSAQDWLMTRALNRIAAIMNARVTRRWQAIGKVGSQVFYIGVVLEGLEQG